MSRRRGAVFLAGAVLLLGAAPRATPRPRRPTPARGAPIDFSGTWQLDPKLSVNVHWRMENAVLSVSQRGNRISIAPADRRLEIFSDEIVADGRQYQKALGSGAMGLVTARWAEDGKSLRVEVLAKDAAQRSVWSLSSDRTVWVRETNILDHGKRRRTRLVFRRQRPEASASPAVKAPG